MGFLKNLFKSKEQKAKEFYDQKSLDELTSLIGTGFASSFDTDRAKYDDNRGLCLAYAEKLLKTPLSQDGMGLTDEALVTSLSHYLSLGVYDYGVYKKKFGAVGSKIINHELAYVYNFLSAGNTIRLPLFYNILLIIKETNMTKKNDDPSSATKLSNKDIENTRHAIYDTWVYEGNDEFVLYKVKLALCLSDEDFLSQYDLRVRDKNGNKTDDYLTIDDLKAFTTKKDLYDFIDSYSYD